MNQERFAGMWKQLRGKVTERWGTLTNNTFAINAGMRDQLAGRSQAQYGLSKEQAARQLRDFLNHNRNWDIS